MSGLLHALRGDTAFFEAVKQADPDTFGISCECGTYYIGRFSMMAPENAICPTCFESSGGCESPALGTGPAAKDVRQHNLLVSTVALLNKLHGWPMPGLRDEYENALLAALKLGAAAEGGKLIVPQTKDGN